MRLSIALLLLILVTSCKQEFELQDGTILIDKTRAIEFARESGIDTVRISLQLDGTYKVQGYGSKPEKENTISIHINQLIEK